MDNIQLSKPLLDDVKSLENAALLSLVVDKKPKANQITPSSVDIGGETVEQDEMTKARTNISLNFNSLLPSEVNIPYTITSLVKLSDGIHYLASTLEGIALYIDMKTRKFD